MELCLLLGLLVLLLLSLAKVFAFAALVARVLRALAFPCFGSGLLVLPLCGAAPTSLCRLQREVGKRKQLKPLLLSGHRGLLGVVVHLESGFVHLHTLVTRGSSAPTPHCVRRGWVCQGNQGLQLRTVRTIGFTAAALRAPWIGMPGKSGVSLEHSGGHRPRLGGAMRAEAVFQSRFFSRGASAFYSLNFPTICFRPRA
ncbi:hypothetical protein R69776_02596 [Paraburkholderia nemoris]|jgi:hypothetical protein|uniref:Secreted protein n=1 Tax=Paraburkholderia nemoris TaxID=2793076 RepID=A0ABN7LET6_9BURK|nr:hypothetical protein R69776_02596 [Paraburkholderia nemoris]CAE6751768.1 hypothetical protein R75777_03008 [Paraburkholderia nemoris]